MRMGYARAAESTAGSRGVHLGALATTASRLRLLLALLDARLHVVAAELELAEDAFACKLTLEKLDSPLDPLLGDGDFKRLALDGINVHPKRLLFLSKEAQG
jgi:hypothetical protein